MRILQILSGGGVNGAILHCLHLTRALVERGYHVTLLGRPGAWIEGELGDSVEFIPSPMHRLPPNELRRVAGIVRERRIDLLHTHQSRAHFFGVLLRRMTGVPCVATAHNRKFQLHWRFNDLVIANSEATRRFHRLFNLVPTRRIETLHYFIDSERFVFDEEQRSAFRSELQLSPEDRVLGIVGDVIPRKGHIHLIRALPAIVAQTPNIRLLIVGSDNHDASYTAKLKSEAEQLGVADRVVWAGFRRDTPAAFAAMDVCVCAALEEAFGLTAAEAHSARRPVVATTAGGLGEIVEDGKTGYLVPPGNPAALADALTRLLSDPQRAEQFGEAGRIVVQQKFARETFLNRLDTIYSRLTERTARRAA
ncbi:MAG: glycosyltransferase family 4 protein [Pirellulaceae bacterium]|nr:glycosyltransferase family 4 protein [Pirellulaceae bacterium]